MMNSPQKHVSVSAESLPLHSIGKRKSHKHVSISMISISALYDLCPVVSGWKKIISVAIWFGNMGRSGQSHLAAMETSGGF